MTTSEDKWGERPLHRRRRAGCYRFLHDSPRIHPAHRAPSRLRRRHPGPIAVTALGTDQLRRPCHAPDAATPGRNRIQLLVGDLDAEIERLRSAGLTFRSDVITGPGGRQILLADPAGNLVELFTPASPSHSQRTPALQ